MNRLLMAAARGARVQTIVDISTNCQCIHCGGKNAFDEEERVTLNDNMVLVAHPDDAAYLYGPISTELRTAAENITDKKYLQDLLGHYGIAAIDDYLSSSDEFGYCWDKAMNAPAIQKQLFLLILAESLADKGM